MPLKAITNDARQLTGALMQRILNLAVVATQLRPSAKAFDHDRSLKVDWAKPGRFGRTIAGMCIE